MERKCESLKEAIDITFEKYGYKKTESFYESFLKTILEGKYSYITSDFGARKYVMENDNFINGVNALYEEALNGQERIIGFEEAPITSKISYVARYLAYVATKKEVVSFGSLSNQVDKLTVSDKGEYLYALMNADENELGISKGDIKRLIVENSYRLLRLHETYSGKPIMDLYSNDNYDVAQRVDIANKMSVYLREIFEGIEPSTLADFINGLDDEVLHEMCGFYDVSRRNFQNTNYINMAHTLNANKETIAIFDAFSDKSLSDKITNDGISY